MSMFLYILFRDWRTLRKVTEGQSRMKRTIPVPHSEPESSTYLGECKNLISDKNVALTYTKKNIEHFVECWETKATEWLVFRYEFAYFRKCLRRNKMYLRNSSFIDKRGNLTNDFSLHFSIIFLYLDNDSLSLNSIWWKDMRVEFRERESPMEGGIWEADGIGFSWNLYHLFKSSFVYSSIFPLQFITNTLLFLVLRILSWSWDTHLVWGFFILNSQTLFLLVRKITHRRYMFVLLHPHPHFLVKNLLELINVSLRIICLNISKAYTNNGNVFIFI